MNIYFRILCILCIIIHPIILNAQSNYSYLHTTIEFNVNTDNIIHNQSYDYYINTIIPEIRSKKDYIESIRLIGSASPEGNKERNIILSNNRANKIYSYISDIVPYNKIIINNNYSLFLKRTGFDESDYKKLRATYIEVIFKESVQTNQIDTIYIENTIERIVEKKDTVYLNNEIENKDKLVFSLYNNLIGDLLIRPNIGIEFYFNKFSFFIEGSFSDGKFFGKNYDIDFWHTGFRKYFNDNYNKLFIEVYGRTGYFDTELLSKDDNGLFGICFGGGIGLGYKFNVCSHWKITSMIRIGFDDFKFNNYYTTNNGTVNVSFDDYVDGRNLNNIENNISAIDNTKNKIYINKTINKDFFSNSYNMYWFGPTYIGINIQRDFYIHKYYKTNNKK